MEAHLYVFVVTNGISLVSTRDPIAAVIGIRQFTQEQAHLLTLLMGVSFRTF